MIHNIIVPKVHCGTRGILPVAANWFLISLLHGPDGILLHLHFVCLSSYQVAKLKAQMLWWRWKCVPLSMATSRLFWLFWQVSKWAWWVWFLGQNGSMNCSRLKYPLPQYSIRTACIATLNCPCQRGVRRENKVAIWVILSRAPSLSPLDVVSTALSLSSFLTSFGARSQSDTP